MANIELDHFEYANDPAVQAAYPTSKEKGTEVVLTSYDGSEDALIYISGETGSAEKQGQEFQIQQKAFITKAIVKLQKINSPTDNIVVRIESNSNGLPSGNLVNDNATKARVASGISASLAWETFTFDTGFWLEPDTIYHLVIERSGARDTTNRIAVSLDNTSPTYGYGNREEKANCTWDDTGMTGQDINFQIYGQPLVLQCYSENTIKQEGSYSMRVFALQTDSLNEYLERTIGSPIDLSGMSTIKFDIRSNRTGQNVKIGIRDSGGIYSEITPNITDGNVFQTIEWDISDIPDENKNAIDRIKITIVNADANNIFYVDNMYAEEIIGGKAVISGGGTLAGLAEKGGLGTGSISGAGTLVASALKASIGEAVISAGGMIIAIGEKFEPDFTFEDSLIGEFKYIENIDELRNHVVIEGEEQTIYDELYRILSGAEIMYTLDDIPDGESYGKVALTSISAGRIIVAGLDAEVTDRMFLNPQAKENIEAWRHASDVTMIDGGDIYTGSITAGKIAANAITAVKIAAGAITTDKLDALAVTAQKIAANAITADKIAAGIITVDKLLVGSPANEDAMFSIYQGGSTNQIFRIRASGLEHQITSGEGLWGTVTDCYFYMRKLYPVFGGGLDGGLFMASFTSSTAPISFQVYAIYGNANTANNGTAQGAINLASLKADPVNHTYKECNTGDNIFVIKTKPKGGAYGARLILKESGNLYLAGQYLSFQDENDIELVKELEDILSGKISKEEMKQKDVFKKHDVVHVSEWFDKDTKKNVLDRFVNIQAKDMLLYGAIRQLDKRINALEKRSEL